MLSQALPMLRHERDFLRKHLLWWFPKLSAKVAACDGGGLFTRTVEAALAFMAHDADLADALLQMNQDVGEVHGSSKL